MVDLQLNLCDDSRLPAARAAWAECLLNLPAGITRATLETHLRPGRVTGISDSAITLELPSDFSVQWVQGRCYQQLLKLLEQRLWPGICLDLVAPAPAATQPAANGEQPGALKVSLPGVQAKTRAVQQTATGTGGLLEGSLPLNPQHTFSVFVGGVCNAVAHSGAAEAAARPGQVYNPVLIYGAPGTGKTHLLNAVSHDAHQRDPGLRIALVDANSFTQNFVSALRRKQTDEFARSVASADILLFDDVHKLALRKQTQNEFCAAFDSLTRIGRQIVVTCDKHPLKIAEFTDGMRSRLVSGLAAELTEPDLETRMQILEARCNRNQWNVEPQVIYLLANAVCGNVRMLDGAITSVVAYASVHHLPITVDLARALLPDYARLSPAIGVTKSLVPFDVVLVATADRFKVAVEALKGNSRRQDLVTPRQIAMMLGRDAAGCCLQQIGRALGGRDHSTVQRGIASMAKKLDTDARLRATVAELRDMLRP